MARLTREEKNQLRQLDAAQDAELIAYKASLKDAGYTKKEIRSLLEEEKAANRTEYADSRTTLRADGVQSLLGENQNFITSNASTIIEPVRESFDNTINTALSYYDTYNIPNIVSSGGTVTGIGLDKLVKANLNYDATTGQFSQNDSVGRLLNTADQYVGNNFTDADLSGAGVRLRPLEGQDNLYEWKYGSGETKQYMYFNKNPDGTYTGVGANRTFTDAPGGFFNSDLGKMALLATSFYAPGLGNWLYGLSGAAAAAAGGATLAGGAAALQGGDVGDIAKSAVLGGIGGYAGSVAGDYAKTFLGQTPVGDIGGTGAFDQGIDLGAADRLASSYTSTMPSIDLLGDTTFPGQGLQAPTIPSTAETSYSLLDSGATIPGEGLTLPSVPSVPSMGGAGGIETYVPGGTVTQAGFTPTGATSAIGDPNSFINNPNVIGQPVIGVPGTTTGGFSIRDIVSGVNLARSLFGKQQEVPNMLAQAQYAPNYTGVDYNALLALLSQQAKRANVASLLG